MTEDDTRHNFISNLSSPRRVFQILPHHFPSNLAPILPLPSLPRSPPFLHFVPGGVSPPQHSEQRGRERGKGGKERRWEERVGCREWGRRGEPRLQSKAKRKRFDDLEHESALSFSCIFIGITCFSPTYLVKSLLNSIPKVGGTVRRAVRVWWAKGRRGETGSSHIRCWRRRRRRRQKEKRSVIWRARGGGRRRKRNNAHRTVLHVRVTNAQWGSLAQKYSRKSNMNVTQCATAEHRNKFLLHMKTQTVYFAGCWTVWT